MDVPLISPTAVIIAICLFPDEFPARAC
jgi:hypothetical protein